MSCKLCGGSPESHPNPTLPTCRQEGIQNLRLASLATQSENMKHDSSVRCTYFSNEESFLEVDGLAA